MIVKDTSGISPFFIMLEADKKPKQVINVPANDSRRASFDKNIDDSDPEAAPDTGNLDDAEDNNDFNVNVDELDDVDDDVIDDAPPEEQESDDAGTGELADEPPEDGETPTPDSEDTDTSDEDETDDVGGTGELDAEPAGDFDDNVDDSSDTGTDDTSSTDSSTPEGEQGEVANTMENRLKYALYRSMYRMYKDVQTFGKRLETVQSAEQPYGNIIKTCAVKLGELEDALFQFMTSVYSSETYMVCMDFYQNSRAVILNIIKMLSVNKTNKETIK